MRTKTIINPSVLEMEPETTESTSIKYFRLKPSDNEFNIIACNKAGQELDRCYVVRTTAHGLHYHSGVGRNHGIELLEGKGSSIAETSTHESTSRGLGVWKDSSICRININLAPHFFRLMDRFGELSLMACYVDGSCMDSGTLLILTSKGAYRPSGVNPRCGLPLNDEHRVIRLGGT
jgi:hypothetical protein